MGRMLLLLGLLGCGGPGAAEDSAATDVPADTDGDGVIDGMDACPGGDDTEDGDNDGIPDACDACPADPGNDWDGDGVCNRDDDCPNDALDDSDGDGSCDSDDPCPDDPSDDSDGDGTCDGVDLCEGDDATGDTDGDGTCDDLDPCPLDLLDDSDGDGSCDGVDLCTGDDATGDADGDGVCGDLDPCPDDPLDDSDGDGSCDGVDPCYGDDATGDADGDGVCADLDPCPLDPLDDSDGDTVCDSDDICPNGSDLFDGDADGIPDGCDEPCQLASVTLTYSLEVDYGPTLEYLGGVDCLNAWVGTGVQRISCDHERVTFEGTWELDYATSTCDDYGDTNWTDAVWSNPPLAQHSFFFSPDTTTFTAWHAHEGLLPSYDTADSFWAQGLTEPFDPAPANPTASFTFPESDPFGGWDAVHAMSATFSR